MLKKEILSLITEKFPYFPQILKFHNIFYNRKKIPRLMTFAKALNRNLWQNFLLRNQISFYTQHILETEMSHGVENITHCELFLVLIYYFTLAFEDNLKS